MRMGPVAAIYDIHGNLPALDAVLEDVRRAGAELVVIGGDVLPGPMPRETLARLFDLELPVRFIRGNGDRVVLEALARADLVSIPEPYRATMRWVAEQLDSQDVERIAAWPNTLRIEIGGLGEVLFCHATPRNDTEIFTRLTAEDRLLPIFDGLDVPVVICGHTHMQFDRMIGRTRVVNAGSVGMPYGEPGAYWLLLGPDVQLCFTPYDLAGAAKQILSTSYPQAREFVDKDLLHPRSESEMLELLAKAELS
jgi:putative phosphoesterase